MINLLDDEPTIPILLNTNLSGADIKKANETRETCISCGVKNKDLLETKYCPNECDMKTEELDQYGFKIIDLGD